MFSPWTSLYTNSFPPKPTFTEKDVPNQVGKVAFLFIFAVMVASSWPFPLLSPVSYNGRWPQCFNRSNRPINKH